LISTREEKSQSSIQQQVHSYALPTIAAGVIIAILYWARVVFITTVIAVIVALILEPFVGVFVRWRIPRSVATLMVLLFAALVMYFGGHAAYNQISGLANDAPAFKDNLAAFIGRVTDRIQEREDSSERLLSPARKAEPAPAPPIAPRVTPRNNRKGSATSAVPEPVGPAPIQEVRIHEEKNPIGDIYGRISSLYEFVLMASFVPFLVYFMLSWRDHIYHSFLRFFDGPDRVAVSRSLEGVAEMARAFVVGNFMIGILLATVSWAAFAIIHVPYPFLAGILSGFLSLVPYAGMVLALLPPVLSIIAGGDTGTVILIVLILVLTLHLTAMNVLYPKIVGARVHLNPLVVTFSLMFFGFLWDAAGLLLAIPITAGIKAVCDNVAGLRSFGRFLGD
jgi:predicted PurR-regulated permease PerM